jgi:hypothetical protein
MMKLKRVLLWIAALLVFASVIYPSLPWVVEAKSRVVAEKSREAVKDWCRLAEFPTKRENEQIEQTGGMFTRGFDMWFSLDPEALSQWVKDSPGLQDAKKVSSGSGATQYKVRPHKAQFCEVRTQASGEVSISTYWS